MSREKYVGLLADLLSGDSDRVSTANKELYNLLVVGEDAEQFHPSLALADAEQRLQRVRAAS